MNDPLPSYPDSTTMEIPPISPVIKRLCELDFSNELVLEQLIEIIATDPGLTMRVLAIANSPFFGLNYQIRTIEEASIIIGVHSLKQIMLGICVNNVFTTREPETARFAMQLWRHSVAVGTAAQTFAQSSKYESPDQAFLTGLLHDVGKIIWLRDEPQRYLGLISSQASTPLFEREQEIFGMTHAELGAQVCLNWNMPEDIKNAIESHHANAGQSGNENNLSGILRAANDLAKLATIGYSGNNIININGMPNADIYGLTPSTMPTLLNSLKMQVARLEGIFEIGQQSGMEQEGELSDQEVGLLIRNEDHAQIVYMILTTLGYLPRMLDSVKQLHELNMAITDMPLEVKENKKIVQCSNWFDGRENNGQLRIAQLRQCISEIFPEIE